MPVGRRERCWAFQRDPANCHSLYLAGAGMSVQRQL